MVSLYPSHNCSSVQKTRCQAIFGIIFLLFWLPSMVYGVTYTATQDGNWNNTATWGGGPAPGSTIGASDIVNINGFVVTYNLGSDLEISGELNVTNGTFRTVVGANRTVTIKSGGEINLLNAEFYLPIFSCGYGCNTGSNLSGNLKNEGGAIYAENSLMEIAQNWEDNSSSGSGSRTFIGGCLRIGENVSNKGAIDLYDATCIELGLHGSGNWKNEYRQTFQNGTTVRMKGSGNFENVPGAPNGILGGAGSPDIAALGISNGNMVNDGQWTAQVLNFCRSSGSTSGSNAAQFNANVTNNNTLGACNAVNAIDCTNCVNVGCTPSVTCNNLPNVDMEGCAADVPAAITTPSTIFTYEACGATVTMSHNDNGDTNFCGDGDGVDFIRTYTLLFNGVPQAPTCSHTIEVYDTTDPQFPNCPQAPVDLGCNPTPPTAADALLEAGSATDNCGGTPVVIPTVENVVPNGCNRSQDFVLNATDACGNVGSCTVTYTWQVATTPVFDNCPANPIDLGCNPTDLPICDEIYTASNECGSVPPGCDAGPIVNVGACGRQQIITYTADACGLSGSCAITYNWTVATAPVFANCGQVIDLGCNPTALPTCLTIAQPGFGGAVTASNECGGVSVSCQAETVTSNGCNREQIFTFTATACGQTNTCTRTFTWKVDVTKPGFTFCPPGQNLGLNPASFPAAGAAIASDNCGGNPSINSVLGPPVNTGGCNWSRTRTYTATDACGNTETCAQVFTYSLSGGTPVFTYCPPGGFLGCNPTIPAPGAASASDECGGAATITSALGPVVNTGGCNRSITRTYTATSSTGQTATCTQVFTYVSDVTLPNFTSVPANVTVQCTNIPAVGTPTATDGCGAVSITYDGQTQTGGACPNAYTLTRKWTAMDGCGNTRTATQRITVVDNIKPELTVPSNTTIACTDPIPPVGTPSASDACGGNVAIVYLGQSTANATCPGTYQIRRTWRATDVCGNSTVATQTIQVSDNQPPVFSAAPANLTIQCQQSLPPLVHPTATDACGGYVQITYLGQVRTDGNCLYNYTLTRTWRATDLCGNSTTKAQVITVQDTHAPTFTNPPADLTVVCAPDCVPFPVTPNAIDNCGSPTVTLQENQSPGDCSTGYTVTRTWTATDQCGNPTVHVQTITVLPAPLPFVPQGPRAERLPASVENREQGTPLETQHSTLKTVQLLPNPTSDWVSIGLGDFAGETAVISIFNDLGQLVWEKRFEAVEDAVLRVNLRQQGAAEGLYTVTVRAGGQVYAKRLVVTE